MTLALRRLGGEPRLALALLMLAGCAGQGRTVAGPPIPEDPILARVPVGVDLLIDVDLEQLGAWAGGRSLWGIVPQPVRAGLALWPSELEGAIRARRVVVALRELGRPIPERVLLVDGEVDADKVLAADPGITRAAYREAEVLEGGDRSLVRVGDGLWSSGAPVDVRRVVDLARGQGRASLGSREDRDLYVAWARAPRAKVGRPAVVLAARIDAAFRERLRGEGLAIEDLSWIAASFAVGDGFDLGFAAGFSGPASAERARKDLAAAIERISSSAWGRALGLARYTAPIVLVTRQERLHGAYRLGGGMFASLIRRASALGEAQGAHVAR